MRIQRLPLALILVLTLWVGKAQVGEQKKGDSTAKKDSTAKPATSEARELFYLAVAPKEKLPPIRRASDSQGSKPQGPSTTGPSSTQPAPAPPPARNLGIRYNLLLAGPNHDTPVDSDHLFHRGDEVAIQVEANHSGYLYVLARQSSGEFRALVPSEEMTDESNIIDPGKRMRVPAGYNFVINDPPGAEHLVLIFSRDPQDFNELYQSIRNQQNPRPRQPAGSVQMADARLSDAVNRMKEQFGTRDIAIRRVSQPLESGEPAGSVYVVNTSAIPSSSIVTELQIRH